MLQIVLRGISGVGKTTLRKMLVKAFLSQNIPVIVQSKDEIRKEVERSRGLPYKFTADNEQLTSWIYSSRIHSLIHPFTKTSFANCVLICDNTHVNSKQLHESEWLTDEYLPNVTRVLIEIGDSYSKSSKEELFGDIVARQRKEMEKSNLELHNWCQTHYIPQYWIPGHSALEDGIQDLFQQLLEYKSYA